MNIFVSSLPYKIEERELKEKFEKYGQVNSCKIIIDKFTGRSKGFGFIEMPDDESAKKAIQELNGSEVEGREIIVNEAEERRDDKKSFGGGDKGGYKGGSSRSGGDSRGGYKGGEHKSGGYRGGDSRGGSSRGGSDSRRSSY